MNHIWTTYESHTNHMCKAREIKSYVQDSSWIYLHCKSQLEKLTRAGFELASSGYRTAAVPVELSSELGTVFLFYPI